jgi:hypothetical protein
MFYITPENKISITPARMDVYSAVKLLRQLAGIVVFHLSPFSFAPPPFDGFAKYYFVYL